MGRKKTSGSAAEELGGEADVALPKKNKKKGQLLVDDDEYMVVDQLDDDDSVKSGQQRSSSNGKQDVSHDTETDLVASFERVGMSQKKKTKGKKFEPDPDDTGSEISVADDGAAISKKGKKGKKEVQVEDDEYDVSAFDDARSVQSTESMQSLAGSKKGKKGAQSVAGEDDVVEQLSSQSQDVAQAKKKNKKVKSSKKEPDEDDITQENLDTKKRQDEDDNAHEDLDATSSKKVKKQGTSFKPKKDAVFALLGEMEGSDDASEVENDSEIDDLQGIMKSGEFGKESEFSEEVPFTGKKKSKQGGKGANAGMEDVEVVPREIDDDADDLLAGAFAFSGKKKAKGKKGSNSMENDLESSSAVLDNHTHSVKGSSIQEEDLEVEDSLVFSGKKKSRKGRDIKKVEDEETTLETSGKVEDLGNQAEWLKVAPVEEEDQELEVEEPLVFSGKKKSKRGKETKRMESEETRIETFVEVEYADDVLDMDSLSVSSGKKKGTADRKEAKLLLDEDLDATSKVPDTSTAMTADSAELSMGDESQSPALAEAEMIQFTGKKKGKKGKKSDKLSEDLDIEAILADLDSSKIHKESKPVPAEVDSLDVASATHSEDSLAASKKKAKKGKKSGRTAQEEEDLDAILAELDGPEPVKQPEVISPEPHQDLTQPADATLSVPPEVPNEADGAEAVESAASKKKKKKKEREKEKAKAIVGERQMDQADTEVSEEKQEAATKGKVVDKKVPKHIREMQERLAKQKEVEERRKREEEEKRRKEEEEQRRLEELEREKEEAKRRRKEREKEKLLKKKQEGKLLTGKQKEEARRLALMREQLLAQKGHAELDAVPKEDAVPKKPKYENKKKRRPHGGEAISLIEQQVEEHEMHPIQESPMEVELAGEKEPEKEPEIEPEPEVPQEESEVEEDNDEDWDAKSWDSDVKLPAIKSAFAEEEDVLAASKKAIKRAVMEPSNDVPPVKRSGSPQKAAAQKSSSAATKANTSVEGSDNETESEDESGSDEENDEMRRHREAAHKREARKAEAFAKRSAEDLRSPICCILGHVDTGKTKLLDCIRRTNVQEGEAGGITQQIGATYFPMENIQERTKELKSESAVRVPGLLVIDTPGHESFTNLRARGSNLCDIAILVVDIMHGLEPQTLESLNLLRMRHTPFVVALNKVDRLYDWKTIPNAPIRVALKHQSKDVTNEFEMRLGQIMTELKEQGLNSELYFKNKEIRKFVSIVPTSAISGEGVPDLLMLLVHLTQKMMEDKLMYISEVQCTVLEVKVVEGLGTTIDVILVNGVLHEGDQIVVCGMQGPIVTNIRALLTPHPMKELRVKGSYQHHKELKAAQGIKLTAQGLEHAIAGTQLYVIGPEDDLDDVKVEAMQDMKNVMSRVDKSGEGVCVQASTLGSLEALLEFLKSPAVKIPVSGINIGPVHKRDVMRASVMLERKKKEYATILAFDVKVTPEAKELAEELGVRIFMADIIYHLFDQFTAYMNNIKEEKRQGVSDEAVFPCVLSIKPEFVFNKKDPIIIGVDVLEGIAKVGTPLCVPSQDMIDIGRIASMEVNHKVVDMAKKGQAVAMKIVGSTPEETQKMFGRHFDHEDELVSHITRRSIDVLKENFRDELSVEEWKLVVKLKKLFNIP